MSIEPKKCEVSNGGPLLVGGLGPGPLPSPPLYSALLVLIFNIEPLHHRTAIVVKE